jgi:uncharacterized protein YbjT (DUF2867 family)
MRALARSPERAREALEEHLDPDDVEIIPGDVLTGEGLERAMRRVEVAYYLIHSMERLPPSGSVPGAADDVGVHGFPRRERIAAERFAAAARAAGVRRVVYLGGIRPRWDRDDSGLASPPSPHLASRAEVERVLLAGVPDSVVIRSSIVIGARSRSFRLLVRLVERMPVLALPAWRRYRTQPIDQRDVVEMLLAAATAPLGGRSLDVGGPDVLTYEEMLERIADLMLVGRPALRLGVSLTPFTARVAAAVAGEAPELVVPLMEGLRGDILVEEDHAAGLLGVRLHSFDSAVERALAEWEEHEPLAAR